MNSNTARLTRLEKAAAAVGTPAEPLIVICYYEDADGTKTEAWRMIIPEPAEANDAEQ